VHELLGTDEVRDLLHERWGDRVLSDGHVDRAVVATIVFERPEELEWLEATLHPLVGEEMVAWRAGLPQDTDVAVVEVPLLFEAGMDGAFDATIAVIADEAVRATRAGARGHAALDERRARQLSQEEKAARADHVVRNDRDLHALEQELSRVLEKLTGP